jgi:hypothetical protein
MHSLLGLSASHLSWLTASPATLQLAYQHRGFAFQGLQESIGNFSKESSDAVLAASILLSWQVTDWLVTVDPYSSERRETRDEQLTLGSVFQAVLGESVTGNFDGYRCNARLEARIRVCRIHGREGNFHEGSL